MQKKIQNCRLVHLDLYFLTDGQMTKQPKGAETTPTENWIAEIFSPPYLFIDEEMPKEVGLTVVRRVSIQKLKTESKRGITFSSEIGGKTFYLLKSNKRYEVELGGVLQQEPYAQEESLVLLKLPSVTHAGQWGQHYVKLPIEKSDGRTLSFTAPDMIKENIPPGFYMMFYVDRKGKPSISQIIRFDDEAKAP